MKFQLGKATPVLYLKLFANIVGDPSIVEYVDHLQVVLLCQFKILYVMCWSNFQRT